MPTTGSPATRPGPQPTPTDPDNATPTVAQADLVTPMLRSLPRMAPQSRRLQGKALGLDIVAVMTSSAATGLLGFVFWTVAARGYDTAEVGRASAIISSATFIAILANFSLGSLYERFLPVSGSLTARLVGQGVVFVGCTGLIFGAVFLLIGPRDQLLPSWPEAALFPFFVAVLANYALQDQVLIGLGRARTIATKNISQSIAKLIALAALIPVASGAAIVGSWVVPAAVITTIIGVTVIRREALGRTEAPMLPPTREVGQFFAGSYAITAVTVTVPLLVPLIVVAQLGTEMNAYFSMCWLVVSTLSVLIGATAAPFIATASTEGADIRSCTARFVILCTGAGGAAGLALITAAPLILGILGPAYADQGTGLLRVMALTLPLVALTTIYTGLARLRRRLRLAVATQVLLGVIVVAGTVLATPRWGITAIGYVYLTAEAVVALILVLPTAWLLRRIFRTPPDQDPNIPRTLSTHMPVRRDLPCDTESDIEYDSVIQRFSEIARSKDTRVAIRTQDESISYRSLRAAAARWATVLLGRSDPHGPVALIGDLTPDTVAVILGSFEAGAPLIPLDPSLPGDRVRHIITTLQTHGFPLDIIVAEDVNAPLARELSQSHQVWPANRALPDTAASVPPPETNLTSVTSIQFTSGSSGEPKAVLHKNGTWLSDWILHRDRFGIVADRTVAVCMPVSFAAGLNVLIGALLSGAEIVAVNPRDSTPEAALDRLADTDIVMCTPTFLQSLAEAAEHRTVDGVTRIVTTGEPLYSNVVPGARRLAPNAVLSNWAGSSETLGIAHFDIWPGDDIPPGVLPAGIAVPHKKLDIDEQGRLTVTSPYLATGYLNPRNASTTFIDNHDGTTTFVTNDRARITDDGILLVLGRTDSAVKIRGYLVEPAEVEAALVDCTGIREGLVVADHSGESPALTAYVAPEPGIRSPALAEIRTQLHARLPSWMVPAHIVMLESLPRNERGKVDRQALPAPARGPIEAPEAGLEAEIAATWARLLHLDVVGRNENFYALGGDSLTVQRLITTIADQHGVRLVPSDLAAVPTVAEFARTVAARRAGGSVAHRDRVAPTTVILRSPSADTRRTMFCFAGAGASALSFAPLTDRLTRDTAVVAFQAQGLENRAFPDWTVSRAAQRHLKDLLALQPAGPYTLVGHSLGAFIATDVANRLTALGHHVELVVMLDPFLPPRTVRAARRTLTGVRSTLLEQRPVDRSALWRQRMRLPVAGILQGTPTNRTAALTEVGVRVGRLHRPQPYEGRTLLVLSDFNFDDTRVWPYLLTGDLTMERIHCDHNSMVREPHIRRVVELITRARDHR